MEKQSSNKVHEGDLSDQDFDLKKNDGAINKNQDCKRLKTQECHYLYVYSSLFKDSSWAREMAR